MNKKITNRLLTLLLSSVLLLHLCYPDHAMGAGAKLMDQSSCTSQLNQAEELYYDGEFDKAIGMVEECLQSSPADEPLLIRAYTILSRTYLARGDQLLAEGNIRLILKLNPSYEPTIEEETPKYVNLVTEVRGKVAQTQAVHTEAITDSSGISPWVWIGAGSAALAIIAIIASGNGNNGQNPPGGQPLQEPPIFPDNR